jgi:hypothetical protein
VLCLFLPSWSVTIGKNSNKTLQISHSWYSRWKNRTKLRLCQAKNACTVAQYSNHTINAEATETPEWLDEECMQACSRTAGAGTPGPGGRESSTRFDPLAVGSGSGVGTSMWGSRRKPTRPKFSSTAVHQSTAHPPPSTPRARGPNIWHVRDWRNKSEHVHCPSCAVLLVKPF